MLVQLVGKGRRSDRVTVALVGRELEGDENLSLRYLAAAVRTAGHEAAIVPIAGPDSLREAEEKIRRLRPAVVGLSMPDSDIAIDALAFIVYLRKSGYDGHITCGGPLATLVRGELLDKHPGLDSVIRHDGELPLTELLNRIGAGRSLDGIAGMTTRSGDGAPALVADRTALATRPVHADPLPELLGVPTARLSTSRGCPGRCPYCGPAALQREAIREGRTQGLSGRELASAGVGRTRYRHFADVADEIEALHHRGGARFFQIIDENLLSGGEARAREWLKGLMTALRERRIGKVAFCLQADPDTLTPEILDLLEELGVIRISLGIEGLTNQQRRALGRAGEATPHVALLERLRQRGFVASFNSIIVHPQSTPGDISKELDALEAIPLVHFDVLSMAVYPGTQMHEKLLRDGRVTGGVFALRFEPHDAVVNRFRAALIRMRLQAIGRYGANIFAHDVAINVALARRLGLAGYAPSLDRELAAALAEQNRVRLRALRLSFALAESDLEERERALAMASLVRDLSRDLAPTVASLAAIQRVLESATGSRTARSNLMIGSSLAAGFVLTLVTATACGGVATDTGRSRGTSPDGGSREPTSVVDARAPGSGGRPSGSGGVSAAGVGGEHAGGGVSTGGAIASGGNTAGGGTGGSVIDVPPPDPACAEMERAEIFQRFGSSPCLSCYGVTIDAKGNAIDVIGRDGTAVPDDIRSCYLTALGSTKFPCLSGEDIWYECVTILR